MTTIAFDGKILAADKQATTNGLMHTTTKVFRISPYIRVAFAGSAPIGRELLNWAKKGFDPEEFPEVARDMEENYTVLVVVEGNELRCYEASPYSMVFEDPYFATGSGAGIATAAMALGKNAIEAIELTTQLDSQTGMGIDFLD